LVVEEIDRVKESLKETLLERKETLPEIILYD
jgi:hypothetical protein